MSDNIMKMDPTEIDLFVKDLKSFFIKPETVFETHLVSVGSCGPPQRHQTGPPSPGD